jgi:hypothetical protein
MNKYLSAYSTIFCCVLASSVAVGQRSLGLACRIETAIAQTESEWLLRDVFVRKNSEEDAVTFRWKSDSEVIEAQVTERESAAKAAETLHFGVKMISMGSYKRIEAIGEEAYVYENVNSFRSELTTWRIIFRKGKAVITLEAPALELAKRFSKIIAESLPAAEQALGADSPSALGEPLKRHIVLFLND